MIAKLAKKTMIDKDLNATKLAEITGYTVGHICNVINGHIDSVRVKRIIVLVLEKDFNELWDNHHNTKT